MVFKLGHEREMEALPFPVTGRLYDDLFEFLIVLGNEYGVERDIDREDGGFVLFCTPGTSRKDIREYFAYEQHTPEWAVRIKNDPEYCEALYIPRDEYAIVLILASADAPDEITTAAEAEEKV